jgi:hypothetical protein
MRKSRFEYMNAKPTMLSEPISGSPSWSSMLRRLSGTIGGPAIATGSAFSGAGKTRSGR